MNPLEDFLDEYGEKQAAFNWGGMAEHGGNMMVAGAAMGMGAALGGGGAMAVQHIYNAATAKRDFRQMLEWNQDLHHEDQKMVNQSFRTLRRFAPDMSKDPLVSGSMVRQMVQSPQGTAGVVQQALQGQKNVGSPVQDAYMTAMGKGMGEGAKGMRPFGEKMMPAAEHEDTVSRMARMHEEAQGHHASNLQNARTRAYQQGASQGRRAVKGMPAEPQGEQLSLPLSAGGAQVDRFRRRQAKAQRP